MWTWATLVCRSVAPKPTDTESEIYRSSFHCAPLLVCRWWLCVLCVFISSDRPSPTWPKRLIQECTEFNVIVTWARSFSFWLTEAV